MRDRQGTICNQTILVFVSNSFVSIAEAIEKFIMMTKKLRSRGPAICTMGSNKSERTCVRPIKCQLILNILRLSHSKKVQIIAAHSESKSSLYQGRINCWRLAVATELSALGKHKK